MNIDDLLEIVESLAIDHTPEGWPAIQMQEVTALADEIKRLRAENKRLRSAALDVVSWDWRELQQHPDHVDWIAAPRAIDNLEKTLEGE